MIRSMFPEAGLGEGGGKVEGDGGGRRDLTTTMMEEQIKIMENKINMMQAEI